MCRLSRRKSAFALCGSCQESTYCQIQRRRNPGLARISFFWAQPRVKCIEGSHCIRRGHEESALWRYRSDTRWDQRRKRSNHHCRPRGEQQVSGAKGRAYMGGRNTLRSGLVRSSGNWPPPSSKSARRSRPSEMPKRLATPGKCHTGSTAALDTLTSTP